MESDPFEKSKLVILVLLWYRISTRWYLLSFGEIRLLYTIWNCLKISEKQSMQRLLNYPNQTKMIWIVDLILITILWFFLQIYVPKSRSICDSFSRNLDYYNIWIW